MSDNGKEITTVQEQSIQERAKPSDSPQARGMGISLFSFLVQGGGLLPPWWSKSRDLELYRFWMKSDHLAGAFYTLSSKLAAVPFRIEPRDPSVSAHRRLAEEYQQRLEEESELGQSAQELFTLGLMDLYTQDNGLFWEVTGDGRKDGPIVGPATGLLHLDSWRCTRTGDPEFPVVYYDVDGKFYQLHRTRVIFRSQMPSPRAEMLRVGFCWASRACNAAQNLIDESVYKQEKMGSRPQRAILLTKGGLDPDVVNTAFRAAESNMSSRGLTRYSKFVVIGDQMMENAGLEQIDLASLPDGFDYEKDTTLGMYTISLTGAVPPRWLWPATTSGATKADAMYQHVAGLTGGPGATLQMIATAIGGSERGKQHIAGKFLPPTLKMIFDFQDDEQDRAAGEIRDVRSQARERDINAGVLSVRVARQQMVSDGEITESQFGELELTDGRLPDGADVAALFESADPQTMAMLVVDPTTATAEEIEAKIRDDWALALSAPNAAIKLKARQAIAALEALAGKRKAEPLEEADEPPVVEDEAVAEEAPEEEPAEEAPAEQASKMRFKFDPSQPRDDIGRWTETGGGEGENDTIGGISRDKLEEMSSSELREAGFISVFRGTGPQGLQQIRPSSEGQFGPGIYFYGDTYNASVYAESGGGVISGFVHPNDVQIEQIPGSTFSRPHQIIILQDSARFLRRGTIPTSETTGNYEERIKRGEQALNERYPVEGKEAVTSPAPFGDKLRKIFGATPKRMPAEVPPEAEAESDMGDGQTEQAGE